VLLGITPFYVAKVLILTKLLRLLSFKLSLSTVGFKLSDLNTVAIYSSKGTLVLHSESDKMPVPTAHIKCD
jgi:hypothetical protein